MPAVGSTDLISWRVELTADGQSSAGWQSRLRAAVKNTSALNGKFLYAAEAIKSRRETAFVRSVRVGLRAETQLPIAR